MKVLILGAGNLLLSDEGFGVHFIRYLEEHYAFPAKVELLDGGTQGLMVAHKVELADRVYIVDALVSDGPPGDCRRFTKHEFVSGKLPVKLSPHQGGVQEMLLLSELRGRCPEIIELWGVIPESIASGVELTSRLRAQLPGVAEKLVGELRALGLRVERRVGSSS